MSAGPLRRLLGALGLAMLAPIALRLAQGALAPTEAAVRAVVTMGVVMLLGRLAATWLHAVAATYDDHGSAAEHATAADRASATPERTGADTEAS